MSEGLFASEDPVEFTVDVSEAKPFGSLRVTIVDPNSLEIRPDVKFNNDIYTYQYSPVEAGAYTISINWWGKPITGSPFTVNVGRRMSLSPRHSASASTRSSLSSAVSVYGSGIEGGDLRACEPAGFWVEGVPSNSTLQIKVIGPQGQLGSDYVTIQGVAKGYYYVLYYPLVSGTYKITTCISGKDIGQSPYTVSVGEKSSLVQGWARGPGVDGTNIEVSSKTWFNVFVPSGSSRDVIVEIEGPKGKVTATQEKAIVSVFRYTYVPKQQGKYKITVTIGSRGRAITLYFIVIAPSSVTKGSFKVWGKGIAPRGVQARQKAEVYFQPIAADQEVTLDIKSEDGEQVPFSESTESGITTFTYIPPMVGCYIITFLSNGEPIHGTPFKVNVTDVSKIIFTGENMDGSAVPLKKKLVYNVDARKAGYGQLACQVVAVKDNRVTSLSPKVLQKKDSTHEVNVQPMVICEEDLLFTYDDALLTQNPIRINAIDISQIKVYGRGIQKGNIAMKSTSFTVDLNRAGSGTLVVVVTGPVDPTVNVTPTSESFAFNCEYTPTEPGEYSATVTFAGFETKGSPYKFQVLPAGGNATSSRITMYGPAVEGPLTVGTPGEFFIALGPESVKSANVSVKGPEGEEKVKQEPIKENEVVQYTFPVFQPGPYFISADFNGTPVAGSPCETKSEFPDNLPKVTVSGKGLREAFVNDWAEFEIDSQAEGSGSLDVTVNGPSGAETKMEGKGNGKVAVKYRPTSTGDHQINVLFNNQAIPGSPFPIAVQPKEARTEVIKLEPTGVSLGSDFTYSIDTSISTKPVSVTGKVLGPFTKGSVPEALKSKAITVKSFSKVAGNLVVTKPKVSEKNKIYTVAFTPRKVGVYLIYVFFGDRLVDKMPYEVFVCDPKKIKVKGPGLGKNKNENSHIDKQLTWEADCTQAGPGTFAAYVGGPDNCTKDVTVEPASSPDQYSISYTPNVPGGYQILFAYSGFQLPDKPTVMISDPSKAQLEDKGERVCLVNEKVSFPLDLSAAGAGKLQASLEGPVQVPIEYTKGPNSTCTFSFTPTEVGKYSLDVSFGNKPLSEKPLEVTAINPSRISVYGPGVTGRGARVNESAPVYVDLSESGAAPMNVTLETPNKEVLPLELVPNNTNESLYETSYVPSSIGYHQLSIDFAGKPIEGSPFKVPIADPSLITYSEFDMPLYAVPGESVKLDFMTENAGPGELTAQFQPIDSKEKPSNASVKALPDKPGHYEVAFPVSDRETYRGTVCYNDVPVCSPITISGTKPTECDVEGPGVRRKVAVGRRTHFTVKPKDKVPKEPLSVVITSPDYSPVPVTINDKVTPYEVQYTPSVTGEHHIDIGFGQSPVSKSPYKTKAVDVSSLRLSMDTPSTKSYKPGDTVEFVADVSTAIDGAYNIDVQGPEECTVTSEDTNGKRTFSFKPSKPGVYSVMPTYDELPVSEDPLWILLADMDSIGVSGSGVTGVGVGPGQRAVIDVDLSKISGADLDDLNGFLQTPSGDDDPLIFRPNELNPGVYTTDYVPKQPGEYTVDLNIHDIPIADSPYTVPIVAEGAVIAEPQMAVMETNTDLFAGLNIPLENRPNLYGPAVEGPLTVGTPGEFFIAVGPESVKSANVSVKGPEGEEKVKQEPIKENEVVQCTFPVFQPGPYFISADFNGTPVAGSPFETKSEFPDNLPKVTVSGKGLREAFVNDWAEFEIDSQAEGSGSLDVTVSGPSGAETKMEGKGNGKVAVKYRPTSTGDHQINVLFNSQAISGSPFPIAVQPKEARTEVVKLEPTGVSLGSDFTYSIDTSKATKPVSVTGKVLGPFTKGSVPDALKSKDITVKSFSKVAGKLKVTKPKISEKNKIYTVAFAPSKVGVYLIYVFFGDRLVDKMPYEVCVCDPSKIKVKGPGLGKNKNENSHIDKPLTWEADCTQAGPGTFAAYVGGPDNCTKDVTVEPASSPDQYSISYTPNVPGGYQLLFAYSGFQLSNKPTVMISDPSKAQLGDKGERMCLVNEKVSFPLDLSAAGAGKLQASLKGPVEVPIEYAKGPNQTCTFSFTPTEVGKYSLDVSFGNKPLSEKPLEVTAINPSRISVYGPGVTGRGARVNESAPVYVDLSESGAAPMNVTLETPNKEVLPLELVPNNTNESLYETSYVPSSIGYHQLSIDFAGKPIEGSPFKVPIADPSLITYSEFDMPMYAVPGESVKLDFMTENAGPGELTAQFQPIDSKEKPSNASVKALPDKPGHYEVAFPVSDRETYRGTVCYNDVPVCSPITISGTKPTECDVEGPGVRRKVAVGRRTHFTVKPKDKVPKEPLSVVITSPDYSPVPVTINDKVTPYEVQYTPSVTGEHHIDIGFGQSPVSKSPYKTKAVDVSSLRLSMDTPSTKSYKPGDTVEFVADVSTANDGAYNIDVQGPEECTVTSEDTNGKRTFSFKPSRPGVYSVMPTYDELPVSEDPLWILVADMDSIGVSGSGVTGVGVGPGQRAVIDVDLSKISGADLDDLNGFLQTPSGGDDPLIFRPNELNPGVYTTDYVPKQPGEYTVDLNIHDIPIADSPYTVPIVAEGAVIAEPQMAVMETNTDLFAGLNIPLESRPNLYGPAVEGPLTVGTPGEFFIAVGPESVKSANVSVKGPEGEEKVKQEPIKENEVVQCTFPVFQPGPYFISADFNGTPVAGSPFETKSEFPDNLPKVTVSGKGLREAFVNDWAEFEIDSQAEGSGSLDVTVSGPSGAETKMEGKGNGKVAVKYRPTSTGDHQINVLFNSQAISGSPFPIAVQPKEARTEVVKLEPTGVSLGSDFTYSIDTSKATKPVSVTGKVLGPFTKGSVPDALKSKEITVKSFSKVAGKLKVTKPKVSEKNKIYTVAFAPSKVGVYLIYVFFGDRLVDKMPYEVCVCDPSKIRVKGPGLGKNKNENSHIDKPLTWEADCTQAGPGTFAAYVGGPDNCTKDVTVEPASSPDQYSISYTPNVPGGYQLLFAYSGFQLSNKPTVMISDPSKAQLGDKGERMCLVNEKVSFPLDLSAAGAGKLQASLKGPVEVPIEYAKGPNQTCTFSFTPTEVGKYSLDVSFGNKPLSEKPLEVTAINPSRISVYGPGATGRGARVNESAPVYVDLSESGAAPMNVTLETPNKEVLPLELVPNNTNESLYETSYVPSSIGYHQLSIDFAGKPIEGSPFKVPIADPSLITYSEFDMPMYAVPGESVKLDFMTENAGPGELTAQFQPIDSKEKPSNASVKALPDKPGHYEVAFPVSDRETYRGTVCYNDVPVCSPITISGTKPTECDVEGPGVRRKVAVGRRTHFTVKPKDKVPKEPLSVVITSPDYSPVPVTINDKVTPYEVQYTPSVTGEHHIDIGFGQSPVSKSPYKTKAVDVSSLRLSMDTPSTKSYKPGDTVEFVADVSTANDGAYNIDVQGPEECTVTSEDTNGKRTFSFKPSRPGVYSVMPTYDELPVSEDPLWILVADMDSIGVSGSGVTGVGVGPGQRAVIDVDLSKISGADLDDLNGFLQTPSGGDDPLIFRPNELNPGVYTTDYVPKQPGEYTVDLNIHDIPIADSPYTVPIVAEGAVIAEPQMAVMETNTDLFAGLNIPLESRPNLYGPAVEGPLTVGTPGEFFIAVGPESVKSANVSVKGPEGEEKVKQEPIKENEVVQYTFPVFQPGPYFISADFNGTPVAGSPFETKSEFPDNLPKVTVSGKGLREAFVNDWAEFEIDSQAEGSGSLDVTVSGPSGAETKMEGKGNGKVAVKYRPTSTGDHQINVLFNNQAISGSPFPIAVQPKEARTEVVKLEPTGVSLGSDFTYSIDTSKATKPVSVTGKVLGPFTKGSVPDALKSKEITVKSFSKVAGKLKVTKPKVSEKNKIYTVAFAPSKVGVYLIYVFFGDRLVDKMPYEVCVCDPSKIRVKGPGLGKNKNENSHIDKPLTWEADCTQAGPGTFAAYVGGPDNCTKDVTVEPASSPDQYSISYTPNVPGGYQLLFAYSGFQLSNKPTVMISDPSKAQLGDKGERMCLVNEKVSFPLDLSAAGAGKLQASLKGPVEVPIEYAKGPNQTCTFSFTPTEVGKYSLDVSFGNKPLSEKPLEVTAINPSRISVYGPGVTGRGARVNESAPVYVDLSESGAAPMNVTLETPNKEVLPLELVPNNTNESLYETSYVPSSIGYHQLSVDFAGKPIEGSPFKVPIADPSLITYSEFDMPLYAVPGESVKLDFMTENAGPGELTAQFQPIDSKEKPSNASVKALPDKPGHYEVAFPVSDRETYRGTVCYNDVPVCSPITISGTKPTECDVEGPGVRRKVAVGRRTHFTVKPKDKVPKEPLSVVITSPDYSPVPVTINDKVTPYEVQYTPSVTGEHHIDIGFGQSPVSKSPYKTKAVDVSSLRLSMDTPSTKSYKPGDTVEFVADVSTAIDGAYNIDVQGPGECTVTSEDTNGKRTFSFTPSKPGVYSVIPTYDELPVSEDPLWILVADMDSIGVSGSGVTGVGVGPGQRAVIDVDLSKISGADLDDLNGFLQTPSGGDDPLIFRPNELNPGVYTTDYVPKQPGEYTVDLNIHDIPIADSPYTVPIVAEGAVIAEPQMAVMETNTDLFASLNLPLESEPNLYGPAVEGPLTVGTGFVSGPAIEQDTIQAGNVIAESQMAVMEANTDLFAGNPLFSKPDEIQSTGMVSGPAIEQDKIQAGAVIAEPQMAVMEANTDLFAGNPLLNMPDGVQSIGTVSGPAVEQDKIQAGNETYVTVDISDAGTTDAPIVTLKNPEMNAIETSTLQKSPGVYDVSFTPVKGGNHQLDVKACGQPVSESPYTLQVFNPSAVKCTNDGPVRVVPGTPVSLEYDISNAGPGSFNLNLSGPEESTIVPSTNEENPNLLSFTFTPNTPGVYEAQATFEGVPISQKPLKIQALKTPTPNDIKLEGDAITEAALNIDNEFDVTIPDVVTEEVSMVWQSPDHSALPLDFLVEPLDADHCRVKYKPKEEGTFEANLTYAGNPLFDEPWNVTVGDISKATVSGPAIEGDRKLQAGKETYVTVNTTEARAVKPKVKISGPNNEELSTETTEKSPGVYDVTFTPVQGGNHQLDVKACGQPVSESPYTLQVFNPSAVQCTNDGPVRVVPGTPVNLEYDISNAGPGSFNLNLSGPEESRIVPSTNEENPNLLSFTFTPNTQGVYEAQATFEGVPISEKPLKIKAINDVKLDEIKVEGDAISEAGVNTDNFIDLFIPMVVPEEVSMEWRGPDHSELPFDFDVELIDKDHCRIKYKPVEEGSFEANVAYAGNPLYAEPLTITVGDANKATVSGPAIDGDRKLQAGKETYVTVNTTEARAVKPRVKVSGPNNEELPTEMIEKSPGLYDVTFTPVQGGNHQLDVKACGQPVSESPYTLQVFNPSAVQCTNDGPVRVVPGTPVNLEYDISNAGPGSFNLNLSGPEESRIVPSTNEENPNLLSFTFTPNTQGVYEAQATFEGVPISEKPLKIKALKELTPNDIKLEGDAVTEAALDIDNEFDVTIPDVVTEEVSMVWQSPDHSALPLDFLVEPLDADHCRVKYKPKEEGTFEANLTYAGNPLFDEPWNVTVGDVSKVTVSGPAIEGDRKLQAGEETYVTVNTTEARAVKPKVKIFGPNNEELPTETTEKSPGVYDVTFTPVQGGNHQLDVKACGQPVSESPYTLQVFNPSAVQCTNDGPVRVVPGTPVNLEYDISNAGPGSFNLNLSGPEESRIVPSTNEENPNLLSFTFTPNTQGVYEAQATFEGVPISEKPLKIKALKELTPNDIKLEGDAVTEAALDIDNEFDVTIPDVVTEEVSMVWQSPDHSALPLDFLVEPLDADHCRVKYKPKEEGTFEANLTYAGNPLFDEPWNVTVGDVSKVTVSGPAIEGDRKLQAGEETYVTVNTTEARAVKPKVKIFGPNNEELPTETTEKSPGVYDVTFTPVQGGNHQLDVKACGQPVSESPYTLQVFNPSAVQCTNDGPVRVVPGTPVNLEYDISNAGPGSFNLNLSGPEESTIVPSTNEENPNLLSFTFTPNTQGVYEAQATFEGVPISEKPLKIKAINDVKLDEIKVEGDAISEAGVNTDNFIDLFIPMVVPEEVSMEWRGPDHSELPFDFDVELIDKDHCRIKYKPVEEGSFEANVAYAGNPLYAEPLTITVGDASKATVSGPAIDGDRKLQAGKETYVTVNTTEARAVKPKVKVSGPNNEELPTEITEKSPGLYDITFTPVQGGNHQLDVKACGQPVSESPYTLQVFNPSAVQCINDGPVRVVPGTPVSLEYDISNAGPGSFNLNLSGPEESTIVPSTNEENPNLLSFTFTPNTQGVYEAQATFEGVPISEKPLKIKAINDVKLDEIKVEGDAISEAGVNTDNFIDLFIPMVVPEEVSMEWRGPDHSELSFDFDVELIDKDHCRIKYKPMEEGSFEANVAYAGNPLYAEPLTITVGDASKATVSGPAIDGDRKLQAGKETYVTVNTTEARAVKPKVKVSGPNNEELPTEITEKSPGLYDITFTPVQGGNHQLDVKACGQPVSESPYTIQVFNPSAVQCTNNGPVRVVPGTPVNLEYDISNAGPGSFNLNLSGPEESTIVPSTNEENPNLLSFTFTPNTQGVYEAQATFEGVPISEKPLKIKAINDVKLDEIKVEGDAISEAGVNTDNFIDLFIPMVVPEEVSMEWRGPDHSELPFDFDVELIDKDHCRIKYKPVEEGSFEANVAYAGNPLYAEPLTITVGDASKATVSGPAIDGDRKLQAGKETYVTVNTTEARAVKPKVKVSGPNNEELPTEITEKSPGIVDITFTPVQGGNHQLDVKACGQPVSESPYTLQVFNPSAVQCTNDGLVRVVPGTPVSLEYDISNAGPGSFNLNLSGPEESTIVPSTNEENPNLLSFTFTPNTQGVYEAQATFEGVPISEKPLKIKAINDVKLDEIKVEGDAISEAGVNTDNFIDLFIPMVVPEEVSMEWRGPDHSELPFDFDVELIDKDHCRIKYKPVEEGSFEANVAYAGNPLYAEPLTITVGDANKATVSGPAIDGDRKLQAGKETYVTVNTTEARAVKPRVKVSGPNNEELPTEMIEKSPGLYDVTFTPVQGGNHQLDVKACGQPVSESPYTLQVFNPSAVQCINDGPVRVVPGTPVNLEYDISNAGPGSFNLNLSGPEESTIVPSTNEENPNLLSFTFTPNTPGVYEAQATFEAVPISEEPLNILVTDTELLVISGSGATGKKAQIGEPVEIVIDISKSGPVPLVATVVKPSGEKEELVFSAKEDNPNLLMASYTPMVSGYYDLIFLVNGEALYKEPLRPYVVNPAEFQLVKEEEIYPLKAVLGQVNSYEVFVANEVQEDCFGVFLLTEDEADTVEEEIKCSVKKLDEDRVKIEYLPEAETAQFVVLTYNEVRISEKLSLAKFDTSESLLEDLKTSVAVNAETSFVVSGVQSNKYEVTAVVTQEDGNNLEVRVETIESEEEGKFKYRISYTPINIGLLTIIVKCGAISLCEPITVKVFDPSLVICTGLEDVNVLVGVKIPFAVDTSKAGGEAELLVQLEGPEDSSVLCQAVNDCHYSGVLSSERAGICYLHVTYCGIEIPSSPFICRYNRPEPDVTKCSVGDLQATPGEFMVDCRDGGGNGILEVAVYGAFVPARSIAVEHNGDYTFNVKYDIPDPVETFISVKWHGIHLNGSPFKVIFDQ